MHFPVNRFFQHIPTTLNLLRLTAIVICLGAACTATGDDQKRAAAIEKRISLAENYLKSRTAAQIQERGSAEARQLLAKAEEFRNEAQTALKAGKLDAAAENADNSIRAFAAAGTANANRSKSDDQRAQENKDLRSEIDAYLQAFRAALTEKGPAMSGLLDQDEVASIVARAEKAGAAGDHRAAASALREAKSLVVTALTKIRSNETVVYALEFRTPADEFRYERERYDEYLKLARQVLDSGRIEKSRSAMFDKVLEKGREIHQQAQQLAGRGDFEQAIPRMEQAVAKLVQGLQLLGIPVSR